MATRRPYLSANQLTKKTPRKPPVWKRPLKVACNEVPVKYHQSHRSKNSLECNLNDTIFSRFQLKVVEEFGESKNRCYCRRSVAIGHGTKGDGQDDEEVI